MFLYFFYLFFQQLGSALFLEGLRAMATILVVDDEEPVRDLLKKVFTGRGQTVIEAEDGEEGLVILRCEAVDLVITDALMPGMSGMSMVKSARLLGINPKVLFVTAGVTEQADKLALFELIFEDEHPAPFLKKPFSLADLLEAVGELLASK